MKIVVLDGYTLNPGDLSWAELEALGPCTVYDRTPPEETVARAADAEIVLTNKTVLSREIIERLPRLRYIGVLATGYNIVNVEAARERNIPVTNVPDYATLSVVQMVFAHLLNLTLHVADHGRGVAAGRWTQSLDFAYWDFPLVELAGLTFGVVGFGRIGRATAQGGPRPGHERAGLRRLSPPARTSTRHEHEGLPLGRPFRRPGRTVPPERRGKPALPVDARNAQTRQRRAVGDDEAVGLSDQHRPGAAGG